MCSTRKLSTIPICFTLALASLIGCQRVHKQPYVARLNDKPLIVDDAMQKREWARSTALYQSGAVEAGAQRVTFEPKKDGPINYAADPLIGAGNFVMIPFTLFSTPPGTRVIHHGAIVPPTHTAVPAVVTVQ